MRITYRTINRHVQNVITDRYNDLAKLQEQLSTGKRLLRPSDDPSDVSNDLKLRSKLKQLHQLKRNIDDGLAYMQIADTAMMSMDEILQRTRELTLQASTDTISANERLYIASEIEQLLRQAISLGNTSFKGDYIFAGTQTKIEPFPLHSSQASLTSNYTNSEMAYYDGSAVAPGNPIQIYNAYTQNTITNIIPGTFNLSVGGTTYYEGTDFTIDYVNGQITIDPTSAAAALLSADVLNGSIGANANYSLNGFQITFEYVGRGQDVYGDLVNNNGDVLREIENGVVVPINITANELLYDQESGINLYEVLINLGQNLLNNDRTNITSRIGDIDTSFRTLLAAQAKNGARINRFDITLTRNETQNTETTRLFSNIEDAELAEVATKYAVAETVYNAALQSAAKIIQPSLVNFL